MIDVLPEFAACGAPRVAPLLGIALTHGRAFEQQVVGAAGSIAASGFLESPAPITRRKEEDTRKARNAFAVAAVLGVGIAIGSYLADSENSVIPAANAAGGEVDSPVGVAPDRYVYYPGTEEIGKDEIRLIAAGTGMPGARRGQAATCFLVELGDGQKFLFDIGTGAMRNVQALMIPANYLTKVFLTHLHTDHWGDLATLWAGGWTAGRTVPLEVDLFVHEAFMTSDQMMNKYGQADAFMKEHGLSPDVLEADHKKTK